LGRAVSLDVLPAGELAGELGELLGSDAMRELLSELRGRYELVVIDAPAVLAHQEGLALFGAVNSVLVVATLERTTREVAGRLARLLDEGGASVLGVVVNRVHRSVLHPGRLRPRGARWAPPKVSWETHRTPRRLRRAITQQYESSEAADGAQLTEQARRNVL
jgi:hypothetical protein